MPNFYLLFYFAILLCLAGCLWMLAFDLFEYFRKRGLYRFCLDCAFAGILAVSAFWLTRETPIRGGHMNEHDFGSLSFNFFDFPSSLRALFSDKEVSSLAFISLTDALSGFSLDGILWMQKILWLLTAILTFAALRRLKVRVWIAALSASLLFFNFLSILNTYTFATTNINLFYLALGVYALSGFYSSASSAQASRSLAFSLMAVFLILTARYELFPPLAGALILTAWMKKESFSRYWLAGFLCFLTLTSLWIRFLWANTVHQGSASLDLGELWKNICHHLGANNLSVLSGLPPEAGGAVFLALLAFAAVAAWRRGMAAFIFFFLGAWLVYCGIIFRPMAEYPLHYIRHHLYFFFPLPLFIGAALELLLQTSRRAFPAAVSVLAMMYAAANVRAVNAFQGEWRTNDREWNFLLEISRQWPAECGVYYPFQDHRGALLRKYFRFEDKSKKEKACQLVYQGAVYQTLLLGGAPAHQNRLEEIKGAPYREMKFDHRFYTNLKEEVRSPIPITIGFYRISPAESDNIRADALFEGALSLFARGEKGSALEKMEQALRLNPKEPRFYLSIAALWMTGAGEGPILVYLNRSVELALKNPLDSGDLAAEALSTLSFFWEQKGRRDQARESLEKALEAASPEWSKRLEAARHLQELK